MVLLEFDVMVLLQKIFRYFKSRHCYLKGPGCVVYKTAKIANPLHDPERIRLGKACHVRGELLLFGHGGRISLGDYCYVGFNTYIWSAKEIRIGSRVLISHNCNIFDNDTHPLDPNKRHEQFNEIISTGQPKSIDLKEHEVIIDDDVLIAANSIILKGVTIGRASIVAAGSVVTKDVPPGVIVAGNPAKIIRSLNLGGSSEY